MLRKHGWSKPSLVGAGQRGGGFHAAVRLYSIEAVLVAAAAAAQHALGPAAQLHAAV